MVGLISSVAKSGELVAKSAAFALPSKVDVDCIF
jgi:hypothetical protein